MHAVAGRDGVGEGAAGGEASARPRALVRPARHADVEQMCRLTYQIGQAQGNVDDCHATPERLRRIVLDEERAGALVAVHPDDDAKILGMIVYYPSYPSFSATRGLLAENIVVDRDARGFGVATQLFEALKQIARAQNVGIIEWVCDRDNQVARRFYEQRLGAVPEERYMMYHVVLNPDHDAVAQAGPGERGIGTEQLRDGV